jgi:hypothetical protein
MITFSAVLTDIGAAISVVSAPTWMILGIVAGIVWLFYHGNNDPKNPLRWEDLVIDTTNNRASPYKFGYMVGVIVSTWVIIQYAVQFKLGIDLFATYLMYLVGGVGWMAFVQGKYNSYFTNQPNPPGFTPPAPPTPSSTTDSSQ